MNDYKVLTIREKELETVDKLFRNLSGLPVEVFKEKNWETLYAESRPFIDMDSYESFKKFFTKAEIKEISIFEYPLYKGEEYIRIGRLPSFLEFDDLMNKYNFRSTGGIAFGINLDWAIYSDPDNHVLFFGYDKKFKSEITEIFSLNKFVISKEKLINIYEGHKDFLKGIS